MKKLLLLIAALALVGCEKQGGTSDQYNTSTGRSTNNVAPSTAPSSTDTNTSSTTPAPTQP